MEELKNIFWFFIEYKVEILALFSILLSITNYYNLKDTGIKQWTNILISLAVGLLFSLGSMVISSNYKGQDVSIGGDRETPLDIILNVSGDLYDNNFQPMKDKRVYLKGLNSGIVKTDSLGRYFFNINLSVKSDTIKLEPVPIDGGCIMPQAIPLYRDTASAKLQNFLIWMNPYALNPNQLPKFSTKTIYGLKSNIEVLINDEIKIVSDSIWYKYHLDSVKEKGLHYYLQEETIMKSELSEQGIIRIKLVPIVSPIPEIIVKDLKLLDYSKSTTYESGIDLKVPNVIWPNHVNGVFKLTTNSKVKSIDGIVIFDKSGETFYEKKFYSDLSDNKEFELWDGRSKGGFPVAGVYRYFLVLTLNNGKVMSFTGSITTVL